jgi:hypothetical protein
VRARGSACVLAFVRARLRVQVSTIPSTPSNWIAGGVGGAKKSPRK